MSKKEYRMRWADWLIYFIANSFLKINFYLSRLEIIGEDHLLRAIKSDRPVFIAIWHGRMLYTAWVMRPYNVATLVSSSRDGEIIAKIVQNWGLHTIRGSSTRGGLQALKEMAQTLAQPEAVLGITMDGPKGPRHVAKAGSLALAIKKNAIILPMSGASTRAKIFTKSWDQYQFPKMFGKIVVKYGEPVELESDIPEEEFTKRVSNAVVSLEQELDDLVS